MVLATAAIAAAWAGPVASVLERPAGAEPVSRTSYVVREGDTLWSIAHRVSPGEDPRPLVDSIVATNAVDPGSLVPGQILVIPA